LDKLIFDDRAQKLDETVRPSRFHQGSNKQSKAVKALNGMASSNVHWCSEGADLKMVMSALGQKQTCAAQNGMSALHLIATVKADIASQDACSSRRH
jgi:hypothetical protein